MKRTDHSAPTRVLLVEGMRSQRHVLSDLIESAPQLTLAGVATNSNEAIEAANRLRPEVVVMNTHLPGLDGFTVTRHIMQHCPVPVVLISETVNSRVSDEATAAGALTVIQHPGSPTNPNHAKDCAVFLKTVRVMAGVPVVTRFATRSLGAVPSVGVVKGQYELLAIAASTGGPSAIQRVVSQLGPQFSLPIVLVQHIARNFVQSLAEWLSSVTAMPVNVVQHEQKLQPAHIYIAPSGHHIVLSRRGWVTPQAGDDARDAYCPSADILFHSVAQTYAYRAIGVILSGMGDDGARGLGAMRQAGSLTLSQDEASCVVYGMPQAAVRANAVQQVGTLDELSSIINTNVAR